MVKITKCDKCGKEIKSSQRGDLNDLFEDAFDDQYYNILFSTLEKEGLRKYHLCKECLKGIDEIIKETNKKIEEYVKLGKLKEEKPLITEDKRKKSWFFN